MDYRVLKTDIIKNIYKNIFCREYHNYIYNIRDNLIHFDKIKSSDVVEHVIDLENDEEDEIQNFKIKFDFKNSSESNVLVSWFDVLYEGTNETITYTTINNVTNWGVQYIMFNNPFYNQNMFGDFKGYAIFSIKEKMSYKLIVKLVNDGKKVLESEFDTLKNHIWIDNPLYNTNRDLILENTKF